MLSWRLYLFQPNRLLSKISSIYSLEGKKIIRPQLCRYQFRNNNFRKFQPNIIADFLKFKFLTYSLDKNRLMKRYFRKRLKCRKLVKNRWGPLSCSRKPTGWNRLKRSTLGVQRGGVRSECSRGSENLNRASEWASPWSIPSHRCRRGGPCRSEWVNLAVASPQLCTQERWAGDLVGLALFQTGWWTQRSSQQSESWRRSASRTSGMTTWTPVSQTV